MAVDLRPDAFFDLTRFAHAALFEGVERVWEVLGKRLAAYIKARLDPGLWGEIAAGAHIEDPSTVFIGRGTIVETGAYIRGPTIIGENCQVRHGAYIRGDVIVGNRCVVGHATEVKGSVMLDGAQAGHFAYIGDSIVGCDVNLGAGTKLANLKMIPSAVKVRIGSERIDTGLRKFGAIVGDRTETGCNAVTSPGTILGKHCVIYPCLNVSGYFPDNIIVKHKPPTEIVPRRT